MERDFFNNKIFSEFAIITHGENCEIVTKELGLEPDRFFNKGDGITSKFSSRIGTRPYGLWAIRATEYVGENVELGGQIGYFQNLFIDKLNVIEKLKNDYGFTCVLSISIETEDAGIGFDLNLEQMIFINKIASRFSCSFITKENIEKASI